MNDNQAIIAATHDGIFHSDEVLALALLKIAAGPINVGVIRSRLPKDWERADYVIDVGGKYDGIKWFDHHMPQGAGVRENGIPYSAFGLLWQTLGTTAVRQMLKPYIEQGQITEKDVLSVVHDLESFVCGIDAHDQALLNTVARFIKNKALPPLEIVTLQHIISHSNPIPMIEDFETNNSNKQFYAVLDWAEAYLRRLILRKASRTLSEAYIEKYDQKGPVLVLPRYCEWNVPISEREHILFVVYPSVNGKYTVQAVKKAGGQAHTENLRMPFPQAWAGLNEAELQKVSEVEDAVFCHRDRFIAAALTLQGAITMANKTIKLNKT